MNYINPSISRVPVFVFPDAPFSDPSYLEQHKIKLAPISFEDSTIVTSDKNSKYVKMFNDKVRVMNQTQSRDLTLTAQEARNLHNDIFALLAQISELAKKPQASDEVVQISMDGGGFK